MAELFTSPTSNKVTGILNKLFTTDFYNYLDNPSNFTSVPQEKGDANKDLHRALYDNGVVNDWEPQHRIMFIHSKYDMVVPFGNYLSFRDAHPAGEGTLYKIDDSGNYDHVDQGTMFFMDLVMKGDYGVYYKWLDEPYTPTGIQPFRSTPITSPLWYTLDGRQLSTKPTTKGIYIHNGVKVVIK